MHLDLSKFLQEKENLIIREWAGRLKVEVGDQYAKRPLVELTATVSEAARANYHVIIHNNFNPIDQFIQKITTMRLEAGFLLSDVQKAFELYRDIAIPLLANEVGHTGDFASNVIRINRCLAYTIHRFSDLFQDMHERKIVAHNRKLEEDVRSRTAELQESELKYKTLVEEINDGYFVVQDQVIIFANRAFCQMHGYPLDEVLGKKYYHFVAPDDRQRIMAIYNRSVIDKTVSGEFEYIRLHKDGSRFPTEITAKLVHYEKRVSNIGLCRDISKRIQMEQRMRETEKMAYIGQITASLSHEIRNPLSAVKMNLQIIKKNALLQGNDQRRIHISVKEVMRLERILTELLDFARPLQLNFDQCRVNHILSSCVELLEIRFQESRLQPILKLDERIPETAADGEKLGQVFINLLLNALEASTEGNLVIISSLFHSDRASRGIEICIEDQGCGIPEDSLEEIYKPFFTTKSKGTGLGLANVKRIIEAHGGTVSALRRKPAGTGFRIFLPIGNKNGQDTSH